MKKNLMLILMSLFAFQAMAQVETLFNRARIIGAFGGPIVEYSQFKGDYITSSGGGGALIVDNFFIGGYGMGTVDVQRIIDDGDELELELGHGGFWLGYTYNSHKLVHAFASTKIGWGGIDLEIDDEGYRSSDAIFVVTPEVGLEVNVFRWAKIAATAGYRFVDGVDNLSGFDNSDYSGFAGTLTFRFGGFGDWRKARNERRKSRRDRDRYDD